MALVEGLVAGLSDWCLMWRRMVKDCVMKEMYKETHDTIVGYAGYNYLLVDSWIEIRARREDVGGWEGVYRESWEMGTRLEGQ